MHGHSSGNHTNYLSTTMRVSKSNQLRSGTAFDTYPQKACN